VRIAVIDIGTNSTRLLIVKIVNNNYQILSKKTIITRPGEGVEENRKLKESAISRVISALETFQEIIDDKKVQEVTVAGTSALREVKNGDILTDIIKDKFDYNFNIISGLREAELVYQGISTDLPYSNFMVVDIGGGSTEFIKKSHSEIIYQSLKIGAVRFTEKYLSNPAHKVNREKRKELKSQVGQFLAEKIKNEYGNLRLPLAGVGGTITTAAAIKLKMKTYNYKKIHKFTLNKSDIKKILNTLSGLNLKARKQIDGLQPKRADIIIMGLVILESIMDLLSCDSIIISERDILWGMVAQCKK